MTMKNIHVKKDWILVRSALPDLCDRIFYSTDILGNENYSAKIYYLEKLDL